MDYKQFFADKLQALHDEERYRVFIPIERTPGNAPMAKWHSPHGVKDVVVWCSNDYMNLSHDEGVCHKAVEAIKSFGVGSGGTRNIAGTTPLHPEIEAQVAKWHNKEAGLIFSSGYAANEATIITLATLMPDCVIFSDACNHASMIQGVRNSRAEKVVFKHNDVDDLRAKLSLYPKDRAKLIAVVSLYSMDGDFAPLPELAALAREYNALLYVDEVHAVGLYGPQGAGVCAKLGVEADIIQANFAKAVGVVGGYIAGSHTLIDCIRSYAHGFIFTTSLPPMSVAAASESIRKLQKADEAREQLMKNIQKLQQELAAAGIGYRPTQTHIVPIIIGNPSLCKQVSWHLLEKYGCYVQPINYPTVPKGQERLRVTLSPAHTDEHIRHFVQSLKVTLHEIEQAKVA